MKTYLRCAEKSQGYEQPVAMQQWDDAASGFMASVASYKWSIKID